MDIDKTGKAGYPVYKNFYDVKAVDPVEQLARHEGYNPYPYKDTKGYWTIGYGTKISDNTRLSKQQAMRIANARHGLSDDMNPDDREQQLRSQLVHDYSASFEFVDKHAKANGVKLNDIQRRVVANLAYNMGYEGVKGFKKMWKALRKGDTNAAAYEIINSEYATEVRDRAFELYSMMKHSEPPEDGLFAAAEEGGEGAQAEV